MSELNVTLAWLDEQRLANAIDQANHQQRPLYMIVLATKPCYIKLASLVLACEAGEVPFCWSTAANIMTRH